MSEYQYYEFAAVDQPLTQKQLAELRACSTRATITAHSFTNEYHWGDLKGEPQAWVRRYFDAHVYSANWGECSLLLRLPRAALTPALLAEFVQSTPAKKRLSYNSAIESCATSEHWILGWYFLDEEREQERFWSEEDGPGWLGRLLSLRDELLRGDTRPLYLGWLARVCAGEIDDDELEPPLPPGLQTLSAAQTALADFLMIDPDWLAAAAAASPSLENPTAAAELDAWLATQSADKLRGALRLLMEGKSQEAERQLREEFLAWQRAQSPAHKTPPRRTAAEIVKGRNQASALRLERERVERATQQANHRSEREKYLAQLARKPATAWAAIDKTLERGSGAAYDQALRKAKELHEALCAAGREQDFHKGLDQLLRAHGQRGAWIKRLIVAGLLEEAEA
jgi:hypothetical protein